MDPVNLAALDAAAPGNIAAGTVGAAEVAHPRDLVRSAKVASRKVT